MSVRAEIGRLKERIRDLRSVLAELERSDERWATEEARRKREEIRGIELEIQSLETGGRRP